MPKIVKGIVAALKVLDVEVDENKLFVAMERAHLAITIDEDELLETLATIATWVAKSNPSEERIIDEIVDSLLPGSVRKSASSSGNEFLRTIAEYHGKIPD